MNSVHVFYISIYLHQQWDPDQTKRADPKSWSREKEEERRCKKIHAEELEECNRRRKSLQKNRKYPLYPSIPHYV